MQNFELPFKTIIAIDLGNTKITICQKSSTQYQTQQQILYKKSLTMHTILNNICYEPSDAYIGKAIPNMYCMHDVLYLLGKKYDSLQFQSNRKYKSMTFQKGINKNIMICPYQWTIKGYQFSATEKKKSQKTSVQKQKDYSLKLSDQKGYSSKQSDQTNKRQSQNSKKSHQNNHEKEQVKQLKYVYTEFILSLILKAILSTIPNQPTKINIQSQQIVDKQDNSYKFMVSVPIFQLNPHRLSLLESFILLRIISDERTKIIRMVSSNHALAAWRMRMIEENSMYLQYNYNINNNTNSKKIKGNTNQKKIMKAKDIKGINYTIADIDMLQNIVVVDFSDRQFCISTYKLHLFFNSNKQSNQQQTPSNQKQTSSSTNIPTKIIECLDAQSYPFGGYHITNIIIDHIVRQIQQQKGMNITSNIGIMSKLKGIATEVKHTLSQEETAYVRVESLPDESLFGCSMSRAQLENYIQKDINQIIAIIRRFIHTQDRNFKNNPRKILLTGLSCQLPLFQKMFKLEAFEHEMISCDSEGQSVVVGLLQLAKHSVTLLDICPFQVRMEADEGFGCRLIEVGQQVPLRKHQKMRFPSGELDFTMRFYQNNQLISVCFIPEIPRQYLFDLFIEVDHNYLINIYASTSKGQIYMHKNMMNIYHQHIFQQYQLKLDHIYCHLE